MKIRNYFKQGKLPDIYPGGKTDELFFRLTEKANRESGAGRLP